MSILLEGTVSSKESSLSWSGKWQFLKEIKPGLPFEYQRVGDQIPSDLIDFVSFVHPLNDSNDQDSPALDHYALADSSHPLFGLWSGHFEVISRAQDSTGDSCNKIEETFFLCGRSGTPVVGVGFENLPPESTLSSGVFKRSALVPDPHDQLAPDCPVSFSQIVAVDKLVYGFGRNQFGRFALSVYLDNAGHMWCEKKYMLSKFGHVKRLRPTVPPTMSRMDTRERPAPRILDDLGDSDYSSGGKRRRLGPIKAKVQHDHSVDSEASRLLMDEADRSSKKNLVVIQSSTVDDIVEDGYRPAFLDEETGEIYEGFWALGMRQGLGICLFADGNIYEGLWMHGREQGQGELMTGDRQTIYVGEWLDGMMAGHGSYFFPNGDVYSGDWKEGMRHGRGEYILKNGCRYVGDWKENKRQGKGLFSWPDGSKYDGDWENDLRHGRGVLTVASGFTYDGMWYLNWMEGRGVCTFPVGQEYHGTFKQGLREGRGSINFPEGAVYEGRFREDRIDGQGTIKVERPVAGSKAEEMLIPIQIQADIRRIHLKAGFGKEEGH